ncbi:hypothetical protein Tco_0052377 [Tanacetum coccineum]
MSTYLKNMAGYKHNQLKSKSYDEIQKLFDKEMKRVNTFVDMNSEVVKGSEKRTEESSKRVGDELESNMSKKQKIDKHVEVEKDDQEEAEMKRHIEIVKDDEVAIDAIPLATKPPVIVEYQIDKDGRMGYFKLIRADGSSKRPEEDYERVLWGDLKVMFEPDIKRDKETRNALSISKLKAAYYPDFRLEELVSSLWIESEHDYDISVAYGISHLWFKHEEFYITRHSALSHQNAVRSHMRIDMKWISTKRQKQGKNRTKLSMQWKKTEQIKAKA